jgi:hypothetical protein
VKASLTKPDQTRACKRDLTHGTRVHHELWGPPAKHVTGNSDQVLPTRENEALAMTSFRDLKPRLRWKASFVTTYLGTPSPITSPPLTSPQSLLN